MAADAIAVRRSVSSQRTQGMRRISFTVLLVAICLLPVGIGSGASAHSHAVAGLEGALANTAGAQAQVLEAKKLESTT